MNTKRCDWCHRAFTRGQKYASMTLCPECRIQHGEECREERICLERNTLEDFTAIAPDRRLACMIRRLNYGDCLTCGDWTLERQCCQQISSTEDDSARPNKLVTGSYAEYQLYHRDTFVGVFDMRADDCTTKYRIQDRIAHYLLTECGWTARDTRRVEYGAITPPGICLSRARRLLKQEAQQGMTA